MLGIEDHIEARLEGPILHVTLRRPDKHNAINDAMIARLNRIWADLPDTARVVLLTSEGKTFCAGLDLSEQAARSPFGAVQHSHSWHECFRRIQLSGLPVVAALKGPVVGGGLELALVGHVRVADRTSYYALPEVKHGFFVGGGASVRVSRVLTTSRMIEMMLTSRVYDAEEGNRLGLSHYLVDEGTAESFALELAKKIAGNTPEGNFAITVALQHIEDMPADAGHFTEALMEGVIQSTPGLLPRLEAFLSGRHKTKLAE
ncbi:MAG: crotonase/enoyl-CoA hydratase family protein [Thermomonas sp.]|uniref:crotonase/enoyl-CoA hydratase family protein n=1 Tax=Thermomonas sp. TaxID=1971895 RepID=UPI00261EE80E|nr:crotonase/enoyl-CoA hydratase family protein [Thermomonas sp.]MCC7096829.1 crotonase/enoyl-CoA hydratase family protein [Thermomonas sp.]